MPFRLPVYVCVFAIPVLFAQDPGEPASRAGREALRKGEFGVAEQSFRESLTARETAFGSNHAAVADSLVWLGFTLQKQFAGSFSAQAAGPYYRRVIDMGNTAGDSTRALALEAYSMFLHHDGKTDEAQAMGREASAIRVKLVDALQTGPVEMNPPPLRVGGLVKAPILRSKIDPMYSEEAQALKLSGGVVVEAVVDASGKVTRVQLKRSLGFGLDEQAVRAIQQWVFQPGTRGGEAVSTNVAVEVNFRLL